MRVWYTGVRWLTGTGGRKRNKFSPDLEQVNDYYNIYLPEDWQDRSFTLRVLYGELHQHEENIDLETSINGAIHY